jgi:hypothetical protein
MISGRVHRSQETPLPRVSKLPENASGLVDCPRVQNSRVLSVNLLAAGVPVAV